MPGGPFWASSRGPRRPGRGGGGPCSDPAAFADPGAADPCIWLPESPWGLGRGRGAIAESGVKRASLPKLTAFWQHCLPAGAMVPQRLPPAILPRPASHEECLERSGAAPGAAGLACAGSYPPAEQQQRHSGRREQQSSNPTPPKPILKVTSWHDYKADLLPLTFIPEVGAGGRFWGAECREAVEGRELAAQGSSRRPHAAAHALPARPHVPVPRMRSRAGVPTRTLRAAAPSRPPLRWTPPRRPARPPPPSACALPARRACPAMR